MQASPRFFDSSLRTKKHKNYKPTTRLFTKIGILGEIHKFVYDEVSKTFTFTAQCLVGLYHFSYKL